MYVTEAISVDTGGNTQRVSISGTTAESSAITAGTAEVTPSVDCYVRQGSSGLTAVVPTAGGANGDKKLFGGNTYRLTGITPGNVLGFITSGGSGHVDITPGAF